ncbi:helix-turn-helix domain-containing protein [Ursidibacter arcticus]
MENATIEEHYTISDLMQLLKVSRTTIDNHVKAGKLKKLKMGKKTLFRASEINRYLEENAKKA